MTKKPQREKPQIKRKNPDGKAQKFHTALALVAGVGGDGVAPFSAGYQATPIELLTYNSAADPVKQVKQFVLQGATSTLIRYLLVEANITTHTDIVNPVFHSIFGDPLLRSGKIVFTPTSESGISRNELLLAGPYTAQGSEDSRRKESLIRQYTLHLIPKKSGKGKRMVHAPSPAMKSMQNTLLEQFYKNTGTEATHDNNIAYTPGRGFVEAIRGMKLTQEHMLSEDLKNYYHQVHGSKLKRSLLDTLRNNLLRGEQFQKYLLQLAHAVIAMGNGVTSYSQVEKDDTLRFAADLLSIRRGEATRYIADSSMHLAHKLLKDRSKSKGLKEVVDRDTYLSSMELRAIETLLVIADSSTPEVYPTVRWVNGVCADHAVGSYIGTGGRYTQLPVVEQWRTYLNIDSDSDTSVWFTPHTVSSREPVATVLSPIIEMYLSLARQLTSSLVLLNYDHYESTNVHDALTQTDLLAKYMMIEEKDFPTIKKAIAESSAFSKKCTLRELRENLIDGGHNVKRMSLGDYSHFLTTYSGPDVDSYVSTKYAYGLPQGAPTSSFLANMVANRLIEGVQYVFNTMREGAGSDLAYENEEVIVYSDNVYVFFDHIKQPLAYVGAAPLPYDTSYHRALTQVRQGVLHAVDSLQLKLNSSKETIQTGESKKMLGVLVNEKGDIRVPRTRIYETNQILLLLSKSKGSPIEYKGHTFSGKDHRRLTGLLEWNKTVGRKGYSQTKFVHDKSSRTFKLKKQKVA